MNWMKLYDKELRNAPRFESKSMKLLKIESLNKSISHKSIWGAPETRDFKIYQYCKIALFGPKSRKV